MFWHVDDLAGTLAYLHAMGAVEHDPLSEREADCATATVGNPFGNLLRVMHNPHYLETLAARSGA